MNEIQFFSDYIAGRYGKKLYRVALDLALGCPNRLERFGPGCVFCAEDGSRARHLARKLDLTGQVAAGVAFARERYRAEEPYIAYFQAFTSTFGPVETLRRLYAEALAAADFRVVIVGTRPDALEPEVVEFLRELNERFEVWIELGVQSSHDRTLELIRRGHDFAAVETAVRRLDDAGLAVACHVIAGLPGENQADFVETARRLARLPFRAVKLHQLLVLRGTALASPDFPVRPLPLNEYEYADWCAAFLRELPADWLVMRLTADAEAAAVIAPRWWMNKGQFLEFFRDRFARGAEELFPGVVTADGSRTLYHPGFRQHFHSLAGAAAEARHKFIEPSQLAERLTRGPVRLLDIGFGLGINAAAAVAATRENGGRLDVTTLECDPRVLDAAVRLHEPGSMELRLVERLRGGGVFEENGCRVTLIAGDARQAVRELAPGFDLIYADGFSPDCNPELWSYDFVRELARLLRPDGALVSYCSSFPYRGALLRAGLTVGESAPFGRKRGGTVAAFEPELLPLPLPEKERHIILESTAGAAFRDPGLCCGRDEIFARRERLVTGLRRRGIPKWYKKSPESH